MFSDVTSVTLRTALDGLAARQRVTADNVANIQTPGFLAGRVQFEDSLREAAGAGNPAAARVSTARSLEPTREDGNNVNLDHETLADVDTTLRFSLASRAVDGSFALMRTVIRSA